MMLSPVANLKGRQIQRLQVLDAEEGGVADHRVDGVS